MKEKHLKYGDYFVCKADHTALNEIDNKLGSLKERMEISVDMLNNELLEEHHKKQLNRFINSTYPNSTKALEEKRKDILSKYHSITSINKRNRILAFVLIIILIFVMLVVGNVLDGKIKEERMANKLLYVSNQAKTYHFDDYCVKLSSIDKKEKITLKTAKESGFKPCQYCCE